MVSLLAVALSTAGWGQESERADALDALIAESLPDGMSGDLAAYQGLMALWQGKNIRAREEAEDVLARDPDAIEGHVLLGMVLMHAEGDLARALHHADRALELFEARFPQGPDEQTPWYWHASALELLERVHGEMGHDEARLATLDRIQEAYPSSPGDRAWPLMRLGRYDEAERWAELALQMEDRRGSHDIARTSLCAIAAERWDREAAWARCREAAEIQTRRSTVASANAAEAALEVLQFDQAERHALDATRLSTDTPSSPWAFLIQLYVAEGRFAEAGAALPELLSWVASQGPDMRQQNEIFNALNAASLLLVTGRVEHAARITQRTSRSPDRHGLSNEDIPARLAAVALVDHLAQRTAETQAWETLAASLSFETVREAADASLQIVSHRAASWAAARRASTWLASDRVLEATIRPYLADQVPLPEWQQLELVEVLGAGVVSATLARARTVEHFPGSAAYLDAMAAELARVGGDADQARTFAERALGSLAPAEALLRARLFATLGWAEDRKGDLAAAIAAWEQAWQLDPGSLRRAGIALPVRIDAGSEELSEAVARRLRRSPRFDDRGHGFRLRVSTDDRGVRGCLLAPSGALLACGRTAPEPDEPLARTARRAAIEVHDNVFAPRVDLSQRDLQSLDGSPTASGRASESLVDELQLRAPEAAEGRDDAG